MRDLEVEETFCVVVADVFYHATYKVELRGGYFAVLYIATQEVAKGTTEVLVTRI